MRTVLVVDDEFGISEALSALLNDEGFRVFTAPNGKQGLEKLNEVAPDLVFVDLMMPVMGGAEMLKAVRQGSPELPMVLMSGLAEAQVKRECSGYTAFLRKPFSAEAVLAVVARLL